MPFILGVSFYTIVLEGIFKRYFTWKTTYKKIYIFFGTENMKESFHIFLGQNIIHISRFGDIKGLPLYYEFKL